MKPAGVDKLTGLASRFGAFVAERYPFALSDAIGTAQDLEHFTLIEDYLPQPGGSL